MTESRLVIAWTYDRSSVIETTVHGERCKSMFFQEVKRTTDVMEPVRLSWCGQLLLPIEALELRV